MRRYIDRAAALQVTNGQCQNCGSLNVVSVLINERGYPTFYACEPLDVLLRYQVHQCQAPADYVPPEAA